jgi:hypothetical protein
MSEDTITNISDVLSLIKIVLDKSAEIGVVNELHNESDRSYIELIARGRGYLMKKTIIILWFTSDENYVEEKREEIFEVFNEISSIIKGKD